MQKMSVYVSSKVTQIMQLECVNEIMQLSVYRVCKCVYVFHVVLKAKCVAPSGQIMLVSDLMGC